MTAATTTESPPASNEALKVAHRLTASDRKIQKLPDVAYLSFNEWVSDEDHHVNLVHIANIHHPTYGRMEVCAKMFPLQGEGHRGLINEITGWLMAHAMGIPQPPVAFLANVPLDKIKPLRGWLKGQPKTRKTWPAFCTQRMNARNAALCFDSSQSLLLHQEVMQWADCPATVALDEHLANSDRHLNNLLRLGPKRFMAIDHDRLANMPGTRDWLAERLDATVHHANQLSAKLWSHNPPRGSASEMLEHASHQSGKLNDIRQELHYWAHMLLGNEAERKAWTGFIEKRADLLEWLLQKRFGLLHATH